tara:strand:+ start:41 stop:862 length:822 start_codon:yes stop_codon:yes gene_type:complete
MDKNILTAKDVPKDLKTQYQNQVLNLRNQGQRQGIPDLEYGGNSFFLDNKGGGKFSLKNRAQKYHTDARRRASTTQQNISLQDYQDFAKRNGYTQQKAKEVFKWKENLLKQIHKSKGNLAYEHFIPTTSQTYGGVEHPRNIGHLNGPANGSKGDKMMSKEDAKKLKIPLSKQSAMQMDFNNVPIENKDVQMKNVVTATSKPNRPTARLKNGAKKRAQQRLKAMRSAPRGNAINTSSEPFGGIPSIFPEVGTMQGGGYRVDADPLGFGTSFMIP